MSLLMMLRSHRLRDLDAVMVGKVNLDEFAMGSSTENSALQVTRNPWNPDYIPGGQRWFGSGGGRRGMFRALGSDTGAPSANRRPIAVWWG